MSFKQTLIKAKEKSGLTIKEYARFLNVSLSTLNRWLEGKSQPHPAMQKLLIKFMS